MVFLLLLIAEFPVQAESANRTTSCTANLADYLIQLAVTLSGNLSVCLSDFVKPHCCTKCIHKIFLQLQKLLHTCTKSFYTWKNVIMGLVWVLVSALLLASILPHRGHENFLLLVVQSFCARAVNTNTYLVMAAKLLLVTLASSNLSSVLRCISVNTFVF